LIDLWQIYTRDLSEFRNFEIQPDGRYRDDRLRTYLAYEEHWPLLIRCDGEIAGFTLVRKSKPSTHVIGEFFIRSEFRRSGVGGAAVFEVLQRFKGNWEISFQNENARAAAFWRSIIPQLGIQVSETSLPVAGKPELPHDVWLIFTNSDA
jgi:predicted acetyltransferase